MNNLPRDKQQLIRYILTRDLDALTQEVEATSDDLLWKGVPGFPNSLGTLAFTSAATCGTLSNTKLVGTAMKGTATLNSRVTPSKNDTFG